MTEFSVEKARAWLRICHCNQSLPFHGYIVVDEDETGPFFSKEVGLGVLMALRVRNIINEEESAIVMSQIDESELENDLNFFDQLTAMSIQAEEAESQGEIYLVELLGMPVAMPDSKKQKTN